MAEHECLFPEEREPNGRLILGPCLTCETPAVDAIAQLKRELAITQTTQDQFAAEIVDALRMLGVAEPDADDHLPTILGAHLARRSENS